MALIASFFSYSYAQTRPSSIHGSIFLQNNIAAEAATVILLNQHDSSVVQSALVSKAGGYDLLNVKAGNYLLLATRLGYQRGASNNFQLLAGQDLTLPSITLIAAGKELAAVTVTASKPFVETRPGKVIINPQASIMADGKSALEILKQSPGVKVDNNDNVSITGKLPALILIDGRATNLTGSDLATLLRSTQGTTVDRIEILRAGSPKYDASAGGIINIILKKGKNIGTNGTYTATVGYGRYYKANTGILFNSRSKSLNVFGNYNIEVRKNFRDIYTDRNVTNAGVISNFNSDYHTVSKFLSHTFKVGADYNLNSKSLLGVLISGVVTDVDFDKNNTLKVTDNGSLDSVIKATSTIDRQLNNFSYNVNYSGKLNDAGENITANLTYTPINRHNDEFIANNFYTPGGLVYRNPLLLQNLSPSNRKNWSALLDYGKPFGKNGKVEAGLKYSTTRSDNDFTFGPLVNDTYRVDVNYSNRFIYTENVGAGYFNYKNTWGKYDLEAGLRAEYTASKGNSVSNNMITPLKYFNLYPSVLLNYRRDDKNQFNISVTRGITRPEYEKLNPFYVFLDLYSYQAGNPNLKPSYSNTLSVGHIYNDEVSTSVYYSYGTDNGLPFYTQNNATRVTVLSFRNLGTTQTIGLLLNFPLKFFKWWSSSYDVNAYYARYKAYPQNGNLNQGTGDMLATSTQTFLLSKVVSAEIFGSYETANLYGINRFKPQYYIDAAAKVQLPGKKSSIGLNVSDVFNTLRDRYYTTYQGLDINQTDKRETRIFRLNFTYRFGKSTVKAAASRKTGNETEQFRMKSG